MNGRRIWLGELRRVLILVSGLTAVGWLLDYTLIGLIVGLAAVVGFWAYQLRLVQRWLDNPEGEPPEGYGLWGLILDNVFLLQRRSREAQSQLESALDYLQDSLASMRDASVIVDARGNIAWANESAHFLLGIRFPDDRGQPVLNLIRMPKFHKFFAEEDYSSPLRILPSAEGEHCLQFEISRFGAGDRLIFIRDVTDNYRLEQMRRDFVGNVSHELRTPLTVIRGYIDTLLGMEQFAEAHLQKPLLQMNEQAQRMENLLKDLLWLSRIESIETLRKTELLDVAGLIEETVAEIRTAYAEREVNLSIECSDRVLGDYMELHSAFSNLILNALKYSEDEPVDVRWYRQGGRAIFSVTDRGLGIAAHHIPRLTERFYRVDKSRSQRTGGTGLGLAIVKHVATSHQSELHIDSEVGRGSTFSLAFPVSGGDD